MKITIMGSGYVGLVSGTYFANLGNDVICFDIDEKKVENLKKGILPIYEPGLEEMYMTNMNDGRLVFSTDIKSAIQDSDVIFLAVGTPMGMNHEADITAVKACAKNIGKYMNKYKVVVNKSTVPVGTADLVKKIITDNQDKKIDFDVVSNPEFLREGTALRDCENPDRIVIGSDSKKAIVVMESLYKPIARVGKPIMVTDIKSAEIIKYASNAMLATRISFMNQLSHLCEKVGADIKQVARGVGLDGRIGPRFLQAGTGYGGSCFPKDVQALIQTLKQNQCDFSLFQAVEDINQNQKLTIIPKIKKNMDVKGKTISVWGIAFKPKTDDIREAPAIEIIRKLARMGANIKVYDPKALDNAKFEFGDLKRITFCDNMYDAVKDSDAVLLITEWGVFRNADLSKVKKLMKGNLFIDARNVHEPTEIRKLGFVYESIGRN